MKNILKFTISILFCLVFLLSGCVNKNSKSAIIPDDKNMQNGELNKDSLYIENPASEENTVQNPNDNGSEETPSNITIDENAEQSETNQDIPTDENTDNTDFEVSDEKPETTMISDKYTVEAKVTLNIRQNPSAGSKIIGILSPLETLPYIEKMDNWYKVLYNGSVAYVSASGNYSKLKEINNSINQTIENVIAAGMAKLGTPYEFGSIRIIDYNFKEIPAYTGETFDCSAFVQYCFYIGGQINLYGDSRSMSKQGAHVRLYDLQRGDVIFMTSTARQYNSGIERIGHVAIYLGDNKIMHTFGTGGVLIQDFSVFWQNRFICAKRMV